MAAQIFEPDANEERARTSTLKYQGAPAYVEPAAVPNPQRLYSYMYVYIRIYTDIQPSSSRGRLPTTQDCRAEWPTGEIVRSDYFEMFISQHSPR